MAHARRIRAIGLLLIGILLLVGSMAETCACGAYVPKEGDSWIAQERALIRWDGETEDIIMEIGVQGKAEEAAWIIPVPAPATVQLGDPAIFDELQMLTQPEVDYRYQLLPFGLGGAAQDTAAAPVTVLSRQTLGPFDVASLAATDAPALNAWLDENGFDLPPALADVLEVYVAQAWFYVALRLQPGAGEGTLYGRLDPIWLTFPTDEIVYPMWPATMAPAELLVVLYVVAPHRVENVSAIDDTEVRFAGWLSPDELPADAALRPLLPDTLFLTKFERYFPSPAREIRDDYRFAYAPTDEPYREVVVENRAYNVWGVPVYLLLLCLICLVPVGGVTAVVVIIIRRRRSSD